MERSVVLILAVLGYLTEESLQGNNNYYNIARVGGQRFQML